MNLGKIILLGNFYTNLSFLAFILVIFSSILGYLAVNVFDQGNPGIPPPPLLTFPGFFSAYSLIWSDQSDLWMNLSRWRGLTYMHFSSDIFL